ncbi:hypothetical protein CMV_022495 [Castanea mollissima]|uniref:Uncharacterized protein n=1 Tax=Castanea mollissima TaxID=60419 RepID=A0A8J4QSG1_9ROSI|nr:hypothetical protein CMV_022495 [Castanea mollissima]
MAKKSKKRAIKQARDKGDSGSQSIVAPSSSESPTNETLVSSNSVINGGSEEAQFETDDLVLEREVFDEHVKRRYPDWMWHLREQCVTNKIPQDEWYKHPPDDEKSDRNKSNRKEHQAIIATTGSVPMAKRRKELEEKNGCEPSPIECFRSMHMKKDGVTFASEKAQKLYEKMDARKSEVASQGEIVNDSQIFFEVTGPPTRGRVLGMGAGVKPRDVYGPSSSSQCSKRCQADRLKEKEDFELRFKEAEDKSSAEKMELQGKIDQLKEEMPHMIANALKKMGFNSMQEPTTQTNAREGNQNVDENTEDDSDGSQKENTDSDDD